jgi:hypothetical protein
MVLEAAFNDHPDTTKHASMKINDEIGRMWSFSLVLILIGGVPTNSVDEAEKGSFVNWTNGCFAKTIYEVVTRALFRVAWCTLYVVIVLTNTIFSYD